MTSVSTAAVAEHQARRVAIPVLQRRPAASTGAVCRIGGDTMGTTWAVSLTAAEPQGRDHIQGEIEAVLDDIVAQMSTWRDDSDLSRFNRAPAGAVLALREPLFSVLSAALAMARLSGGAYDPTVGPLVNLWGFGPEPQRVTPPSAAAIAEGRSQVGWDRIVLDADRRTAVQPGGVAVDLSAIGKGYAVDAVAACLLRLGVESFLVDIGGELRGAGVKPDGQPWWVAIEGPPAPVDGRPSPPETLLALCDVAVATSGDYRRYFDHAGHRYAHTIDPRTGRPVSHGLASVTVVHGDCMTADAVSTALTVLGVDEGLQFCVDHDLAALFVQRTPGGLAERLSPAFLSLLA